MKPLKIQSQLSFKKLVELERYGMYDDALAELKGIWDDTAVFPQTDGLERQAAAEVILRCGGLIGFLGHNKQIPNAQEKSKNLLTEAHRRFLDIYNVEKIAECENYLALAYWRTGEMNEAETFVEEALSHNLPISCDARIYSYLIKSLIFLSTGKNKETVSLLGKLEIDFRRYGDAFLNGSFYTNWGIALIELGEASEAQNKLELARYYHQKSRHKIYLGTVENNLAQLYKSKKLFVKAHQAIDSGTKIFKQIKDRTREGFSLDTKAQIYFAERKFAEALKTVEKGIAILKKSENAAYLIETYLTKAKILIYSDDFTSAVFSLFDAVQIAKIQVGEEAAGNLIREFENALIEKNKIAAESSFEQSQSVVENLELVLPASISHYSEIQGVWIKNAHLEKLGLKKGSLAIVAKTEIKRGDLAAITEKETGTVVCGFYDNDFGIVCLVDASGEPQLYEENDITILGRVIAVCNSGKNADGKMIAEPLNI
ncbi:MAG: hypothetical protein JWN60_437 [Acidobacteria bacterium]|jgi:tetratricopeptide (TPR) repeat protein|nr:hypothetical protein [Acidobacteriota bacterium]